MIGLSLGSAIGERRPSLSTGSFCFPRTMDSACTTLSSCAIGKRRLPLPVGPCCFPRTMDRRHGHRSMTLGMHYTVQQCYRGKASPTSGWAMPFPKNHGLPACTTRTVLCIYIYIFGLRPSPGYFTICDVSWRNGQTVCEAISIDTCVCHAMCVCCASALCARVCVCVRACVRVCVCVCVCACVRTYILCSVCEYNPPFD